MRFSSLFIATAAAYLTTTTVSAAALDARRKCEPVTTTVTVTATPSPSTTTSTESMPSSEPTAAPPGGSGVFASANFFPVAYKKAYSTLPQSFVAGDVEHVDLDLERLSATKISKGVSQDVVSAPGGAPDGVQAFQAKYPKGSFNPSGTPRGGFGFYLGSPAGAPDFSFEGANEVVFSYAVYFPDDFDWVKGGKLPGGYGGSSEEMAYGCSGGRQEGRDQCFSLRMMWRKDGMGEIYAYVPKAKENDDSFKALQGTIPDSDYGYSVARGAFTFPKGAWTVLAERVKLNTVGSADGEIELFVNGESKIKAEKVIVRQRDETAFRGFHFQTFFGGSNLTWATPQDTETYFAGVSAAIIA